MANVTVVQGVQRLLVRSKRNLTPVALDRELVKIEELTEVSSTMIADGDEILYSIDVRSPMSVECVAELVRGRLEWLEKSV